MFQAQQLLEVQTPGRGLHEITKQVAAFVHGTGVRSGLITIFCKHTSASLLIQENADPSAGRDLLAWLERLAPDGDPHYTHTAEGSDDMPAHLRSAVTRTSEVIPIVDGALGLGTWQGVFLAEHRTHAHRRVLILHVVGSL